MIDFKKLKSDNKKNKKKVEEILPKFQLSSSDKVERNRREKYYSGSYCRDTFLRHKNWKNGLTEEDKKESEQGLYIEKPKETYKAFNSIEQFDVIGCLKVSRPFHPKAYIVIEKNKDEEIVKVLPWTSSWLEQTHTKDSIIHYYKEYEHSTKSINSDNKITVEDISLTISLEKFVKLYKFDKKMNKFRTPEEDIRRVKILRMIPKEETKKETDQ